MAQKTLAFVVLSAALAAPGLAGDIKLTPNQIPAPPGPLRRLKLSRAEAPTDFVRKVLADMAPGVRLEPLGQSAFAQQYGLKSTANVQAAIYKDHVVASIDMAKGHADVMPVLDSLAPIATAKGTAIPALPKDFGDRAGRAAAEVLAQGVFVKDVTRPELDKMLTLSAAQLDGPKARLNRARSGPLLASFPVRRMVENLPVFGVGSRGLISIGADGKVVGFSRHWQAAADYDRVTEDRTPAQIADLIRKELAEAARTADVTVQDVRLGYYDADAAYIQPVYQFRARVRHAPRANEKVRSDDDFVAGYIPIGAVLEPIPSLTDKPQELPGVPQGAPTDLPLADLPAGTPTFVAANDTPVPPGDPTIGRYVVRNDYVGWVNSANGFWNGLMASGSGGAFTNAQYYWAYPYEFQGSKNSFINSVHVAEIEVHGDWWLWTTYQNWGDVVTVDSIPTPGLGASAGGVCAYFIIHSCEVVPSAADVASWPDKWWHVFQGLHSVLGYRTIMYIDDGAMWPFGVHAGWGHSLVSAWLSDVASSPLYWFRPGQVMHGVWKPYGRPSTISVCGRENDSVYNVGGVGPAGCLRNYWYN
jgi:hypothetical protein